MIEGIHVVRKLRKGKPPRWYVYAYRGGPQIARRDGWDRPQLNSRELERLVNARRSPEVKQQATLGKLAWDWRNSPDWDGLAKSTKKTWNSALTKIEQKWGETPLTVWGDPRMSGKVMAWRDSRAKTPRAADIGVTVLRALLEFGRLRGRVPINVATGIPQLYKNGSRAEIIWTDDDIVRFEKACIELDKLHVFDGLRLAALTGMRQADLVSLKWSEICDEMIRKKAAKTSRGKRRYATIPRIPELDALLDELRHRHRQPGVETVLVNSFGRPWSSDGFGGSFNRVRDHVGIIHTDAESGKTTNKHMHDLRGTFCTKLILAGLNNREIADIMAWSPDQVDSIRRTYVDQSAVIVAIGDRIKGRV